MAVLGDGTIVTGERLRQINREMYEPAIKMLPKVREYMRREYEGMKKGPNSSFLGFVAEVRSAYRFRDTFGLYGDMVDEPYQVTNDGRQRARVFEKQVVGDAYTVGADALELLEDEVLKEAGVGMSPVRKSMWLRAGVDVTEKKERTPEAVRQVMSTRHPDAKQIKERLRQLAEADERHRRKVNLGN